MRRDRQAAQYERDIAKLQRDVANGDKRLRDAVEFCALGDNRLCGSLYIPTFVARFGGTEAGIRGALADVRKVYGREIRPVRTYHRYGFQALDPETVAALISGQLRNVRIADHQYVDIDRTGLLVPIFRSSTYLQNIKASRSYQRAADRTGFAASDIETVVELADRLELDPTTARRTVEQFLREIGA